MATLAFDTIWGTKLLRLMRIMAAFSLSIALAEYVTLKLLERQDSCLAYVELMPLFTLSSGIAISGATAILASFGAHFERFVGPRFQTAYRFTFLALIPLVLGLLYLYSEYAPLVQIYFTNPDVFCD